MNYSNISVNQLENIKQLSKLYGEDSFLHIASYLLNTNVEEMPVSELQKIIASLQFLNEEIPQVKLCDSYTINGTTYALNMNPSALTIGQFMDLQAYKDNGASFVDLLSVVLIPSGHGYNDGYDMEHAKNDLGLLSVTDANAIVFFFLNLLPRYATIFQRFLKKSKIAKKLPKELQEQLAGLISYLSSFVSQK